MEKKSTASIVAATVPPKYCVIGSLRESLGFRSREAMGRNWSYVFLDRMLPNDHESVEPNEVIEFVSAIAVPLRGRPGDITRAAQKLIDTFSATKTTSTPTKKIKSPVDVVVEKIDDMNADIVEQPDVSEKIDDMNADIVEQPDVSEKIDDQPQPAILTISETSTDEPRRRDVFDNVGNRIVDWVFGLTKLDVVYWFTLGVADYGLVYILKEMGIVAAVVYTLISLHALDMAKNRRSQVTASTGIVAVWCLEIGSFAVHLTMFNRRLWASIAELPFQIDDIETEGRPYYIAVVLALLLSAAGIYAVSTTLSLLREGIDADSFEHDHKNKY